MSSPHGYDARTPQSWNQSFASHYLCVGEASETSEQARCQGHSAAGVKPLLREKMPPSRLFHGTIASNLESIGKTGLLPLNRHHVHLSPDEATAQTVGKRRGIAVVLVVDSARMSRDGHKFFVSANDVWLVAAVPAKYLTLPI